MADPIIQEIGVTGDAEAISKFDKFAQAGELAYLRIEGAAVRAANTLRQAGTKIEQAIAIDTTSAQSRIAGFTRVFENLGGAIKGTGKQFLDTGRNVTRLGTRFALAASGVAFLASRMTFAARDTNSFAEEQRAVISVQKQADVAAQVSAQQHGQAIDEVNRQFAQGKLSVEDYSNALSDLAFKRQQQIALEKARASIQESEAREAARAKVQVARQAAFLELSRTVGAQAASAFVQLGNTLEQLKNQLIQALGPNATKIINAITTLVANNSARIVAFLSRITEAIAGLFGDGGQLSIGQQLFDGIATAIGVVAAVVNNVLIPAFQALVGVLNFIAGLFNSIFGTNFTGLQLGVIAGLTAMVGGFRLLTQTLILVAFAARGVAAALALALANPIVLLIAAIVAGLVALYFALKDVDWAAFAKSAADTINAIIDWFKALPDAVTAFFVELWNKVKATWNEGVTYIRSLWDGFVKFFIELADKVLTKINDVTSSFKKLFGVASGAGGDGTPAPGFAGGGAVHGPGTSTSDGIFAWLSNNEYVVRARAVMKYGTGLLDAINSGRFNFGEYFRGFATGGLASLNPAASFAGTFSEGESYSGAQRPLQLTIGDQTFRGLTIPDREAERLERFATSKQLRSAGRRPDWMR